MPKPAVKAFPILKHRRAGVLLHPTSLPGSGSQGTLGIEAHHFVDFIADAGLSVWQMLPTGPTHSDLSPYQSLSVHAGNPDLICLEDLVRRGWVPSESVATQGNDPSQIARARSRAAPHFFSRLGKDAELGGLYEQFCLDNRHWLDDYALFDTLREHFSGQSWNQWPAPLRSRQPRALTEIARELKTAVDQRRFEQFCFTQQWQSLRDYAAKKGVYLFGDIPIFVAYDSAEVWAHQKLFKLDPQGNPLTVAGVPPDYFSSTGQHWGNPHYNWEEMQAQNFRWWRARLGTQLARFDLIRLDHFRGLEAYWEIPGKTQDAILGQWVKAPGRALLSSLYREYKTLPLVAENLGFITEEVENLRHAFKLPGMVVLQFAFDGNADNPHLPHNHHHNEVVYTGTHDNDTTLGWYQNLSHESRAHFQDYCHSSSIPMPWLLVKVAMASVAQLAIVPLQDLLALGNEHRMNTPGTQSENWRWRFEWAQVPLDLTDQLRHCLSIYGRIPEKIPS